MYLPALVGAAVCGLPALAAPAAQSGSSVNDPGTLQVLHYNNLGPENNGTSAVLSYDRKSSTEARKLCSSISEQLYPYSDAPESNRTELQYEFDYLVYTGALKPDDSVWVSGGSGNDCKAYSCESRDLVSVSCDSKLSTLCTSSPPPTVGPKRKAVPSTEHPVSFDGYTVTGFRDARSFRFLGIPFADPPVNKLRFAPPQPYTGKKEIDGTQFSDSCVQPMTAYGTKNNEGISEDCLYLDVYTPIVPAPGERKSTNRPVAVYLYGGAFTEGSASLIGYDGGNFASRNDVVIVTVNYRLGALGYLQVGDLTTGSYGIRDQIMALKWVNEHISAFGGDPSQVTIFGQSAGGQSVVALLSSSAANGLFSGAIAQSAPVDLPWYTRDVYTELVTPHISKAVGCNDTSSEKGLLSCLRSVPATDYISTSDSYAKALSSIAKDVGSNYLNVSPLLAAIEPIMPSVDDSGSGVIDDQFHTLLKQDKLPNKVPVMFTTVTDESALFVYGEVPNLGSSEKALDSVFSIAYSSGLANDLANSDAFHVNSSHSDAVRREISNALTFSEWTCPQGYLLNHDSGSFPKAYEVQIGQGHESTDDAPGICSPNQQFNASCHASDVLLVWGTLNSKTLNVDPYYGPRDVKHSQLLNDIWGSFFRTHDPNPDHCWLLIRGPAYEASYEVFGESDYRIEEYAQGQEKLSLLDMPPRFTPNPEMSPQCAVFRDYGFTFQHANVTK